VAANLGRPKGRRSIAKFDGVCGLHRRASLIDCIVLTTCFSVGSIAAVIVAAGVGTRLVTNSTTIAPMTRQAMTLLEVIPCAPQRDRRHW
jgi:hypothetical protein